MDEYTYQAMWDIELSFNILSGFTGESIETLADLVQQYREHEEQWQYA